MDRKTVGILGGGQLGRMLVEAANRMNINVLVLDAKDSPAKQISSADHPIGTFTNTKDIRLLATKCDVLTIEIEHVDCNVLDTIPKTIQIHPAPSTIRLCQDKYMQKKHLQKNSIPLGPFIEVSDHLSVLAAAKVYGYPLMLKSKTLAYDGRGNCVIKQSSEIEHAISSLTKQGQSIYCEKWVPYLKELAVMVARSVSGEIKSYPCVETVQKDNICHLVIAPAQIDGILAETARMVAESAVSCLDGAGIFGVEMFLTANGEILVNEIAPRPHNSGHYTIEACATSQYEQHIRCVTGLPLGDASMKVQAAVMVNILGTGTEMSETLKPCFDSLFLSGSTVHLYGKQECRKGRKMGHITLVGQNLSKILLDVAQLTQDTNVLEMKARPVVGVIMGSDSDLPTVKAALVLLKSFGVPFEVEFVSAHRTPARMCEYAQTAYKRGLKVILAAAGGAAHLPGNKLPITKEWLQLKPIYQLLVFPSR